MPRPDGSPSAAVIVHVAARFCASLAVHRLVPGRLPLPSAATRMDAAPGRRAIPASSHPTPADSKPRRLHFVLFPFDSCASTSPTLRRDPASRAQLPRRWLASSDPLHLLPFPSRVLGVLLGSGEQLTKEEVIGSAAAGAGGGSLPGFLVRKNRYARVDAVLPQDDRGGGVRATGGSRRYIFPTPSSRPSSMPCSATAMDDCPVPAIRT